MNVLPTRGRNASASGPWSTVAAVVGLVAAVVLSRRRHGPAAVPSAPDTAPAPASSDRVAAPEGPTRGPTERLITAGIAVCMVVAVMTVAVSFVSDDAARAGDRLAVGELPVPSSAASGAVRQGPPPVTIALPSIGVESELEDLRLSVDGFLGVPRDAARAGWWSQGVAPGEQGPAVIVGHVDSYDGPGVFILLHRLQPGDEAVVRRNDGTSVTFVVDAVHQFEKDSFPTEIVYGATDEPTLRLITCGGTFDEAAGSYRDNVVVFAHLKPEAPA